jgi:hypothetical protein
MNGHWQHNSTVSCSVCGHIHAKHSQAKLDLIAKRCSDCGYCARVGRLSREWDAIVNLTGPRIEADKPGWYSVPEVAGDGR